jgi:hypothetical protein
MSPRSEEFMAGARDGLVAPGPRWAAARHAAG